MSNFLHYDPINYSFLGKKRKELEGGRQEKKPAEKINTNKFSSPSSFSFTLTSRGIRSCTNICNYMTITVHVLSEPWILSSLTNALGYPNPVMERKLLLDVLTLGYSGLLFKICCQWCKIRKFSVNYSNYGDMHQIWDSFIKATFSHHAPMGWSNSVAYFLFRFLYEVIILWPQSPIFIQHIIIMLLALTLLSERLNGLIHKTSSI